jgi:hypothetical protein
MKKEFLPFACVGPISILAWKVPPADMVPPTELLVVISLGALIFFGLLVGAVVGVSIVVIRAIKKSLTPKDNA